MKTGALLSFLALLIIGLALNSQEELPKYISDAGGTAALIGGIGFAIYIILQMRSLK